MRLKTWIWIGMFTNCCFTMYGQNLILNPSFELKDTCFRDDFGYEYYYPKYWSLPDGTTPDFINNCAKNSAGGGIPFNNSGYQWPRTGMSMAGLWTSIDLNIKNGTTELMQGTLSRNLTVNDKYRFRFYYNITEDTNETNSLSSNLGIAFVDSQLKVEFDLCDTNILSPLVKMSSILKWDTMNWVQVDLEFVATKPYKYFIFGLMDTIGWKYRHLNSFRNDLILNYILFDDFSLVNLTHPQVYKPHISNVFTPNGDGKNDEYISYWELDPPEKFSMKIYNRWGAKLFDTNSIFTGWDGKYMGNEVPEGAYFAQIIYTLDGVEHKINQPLYLLR